MAGLLGALAFGLTAPYWGWGPYYGYGAPYYPYGYPWMIGRGWRRGRRGRGRRSRNYEGYGSEKAYDYYGKDPEKYDYAYSYGEEDQMSPDEFLHFVSKQAPSVKTEDLKLAKYAVNKQHKKAIEMGDDEAAGFFNNFHAILSSALADKLGVHTLSRLSEDDILPEDILYEKNNPRDELDREAQFDLFTSMAYENSPEEFVARFDEKMKEWKNHIRSKYINVDGATPTTPFTFIEPEMEKERQFVVRDFDFHRILSEHDFLSYLYISIAYVKRLNAHGYLKTNPTVEAAFTPKDKYLSESMENNTKVIYNALKTQVYDWSSGIDFAALRGTFIDAHLGFPGKKKNLAAAIRDHNADSFEDEYGAMELRHDPRAQESDMLSKMDAELIRKVYVQKAEELRKKWKKIMRIHIKKEKQIIDLIMEKTKNFINLTNMEGYPNISTEDWFQDEESVEKFRSLLSELMGPIAKKMARFWAKDVIGYSLGEHEDDEAEERTETLKGYWAKHVDSTLIFARFMTIRGPFNTDHAMMLLKYKDMFKTGQDVGDVLNDMLYLELGETVSKRKLQKLYRDVFSPSSRRKRFQQRSKTLPRPFGRRRRSEILTYDGKDLGM